MDRCPTCHQPCDSEYVAEMSDRWTDAIVYYCEDHDTYPVIYQDSYALEYAIQARQDFQLYGD